METENINRAYLETLSFSDLSKLADEYGVDVPEDLDRRFLICELLDIVEESKLFSEDMIVSSEYDEEENITLPHGYNETQISCVLRNPVWAFVFWNISSSDYNMLKEQNDCVLMLRVCSLPSIDELAPKEAFEVKVSAGSQEQYVLLPAGERFIRIELVYVSGSKRNILAFSPVIEVPQGSASINNIQPGNFEQYPEIIKLSGIEKILLKQYKNHRHSFSG